LLKAKKLLMKISSCSLALERLIINIGEACSKLSIEFQNNHPEIEWKNIVGMRTLIHAYHRIESEQVWEVGVRDIPNLIKNLNSN
jgi:uncharacterized protein with HEPN domain